MRRPMAYFQRMRGTEPDATWTPRCILARSPVARRRWYASYVRLITERDVAEISRVRDSDTLRRLPRMPATRRAQGLNPADIARDLQSPRSTLAAYVPLLETLYRTMRGMRVAAGMLVALLLTPVLAGERPERSARLAARLADEVRRINEAHVRKPGAVTEAALDLDLRDVFARVRERLAALDGPAADALGVAVSRERFVARGIGGLSTAYMEHFADVLDAILDQYRDTFGFAEWSKVPGKKLRVRYYTFDELRDALLSCVKGAKAKKAVKVLLR